MLYLIGQYARPHTSICLFEPSLVVSFEIAMDLSDPSLCLLTFSNPEIETGNKGNVFEGPVE